ncbi:uncharacterized protein Z518_10110 [Rhinocladiella mackenziei CBS 650.93]|uniref:Membrane transporter n=1 Tax=Rhinocladiella mackenziei CBS 650.93 TaxID=1442369 RepID=A0A0D2I5J0_9EURO|nr:uncharacterized protein Z518_10110 [Rhinocladiella mackenziei CBS 650.93]KIX01044.1 hypothetical protein Z518_10110 [Rhinocladiella mackenziei CBS 650.93]
MRLHNKLRLSRPFNQNLVVACILFCLPGIYTAITGLGAGGGKPSSADVANQTNAILYGLFALVGLFGGTILNMLRPKLSLMIGSIGYPVYVGGLWYYDRTGNSWFPLLAGAILGISGGFLWTAAAYVQFAYAEEKDKAKYISIQWMLKCVGAMVGGSISLSLNVHETKAVGVSNAVYATFVVLHSCAFFIAMIFIINPKNVVRDDGTHIAIFKPPRFWLELKATLAIMLDHRYLILAPAQIVCEMALALVSSVNSRYFNLRTRSLNNFSYQTIQVFIPGLLILVLDNQRIKSRQTRGLIGLGLMSAVSIGACAGLIAWLEVYNVDDLTEAAGEDWTDAAWPGLFVCYLLFGMIYAGYQMVVEYTLASTTNDPSTLARVAGMFKCYSSFGMMISFIMAGERVTFLGQVILQFVLYVLGAIGVAWVLIYRVKDSNYFTEEDVIVPLAEEERSKLAGLVTEEQIAHEHEKELVAAQGKKGSATLGQTEITAA